MRLEFTRNWTKQYNKPQYWSLLANCNKSIKHHLCFRIARKTNRSLLNGSESCVWFKCYCEYLKFAFVLLLSTLVFLNLFFAEMLGQLCFNNTDKYMFFVVVAAAVAVATSPCCHSMWYHTTCILLLWRIQWISIQNCCFFHITS